MVRTNAASLRKKIQALATRSDNGSLDLAQALAEARSLPKPPQGDRPTLADLVELTGLSRRAINYLVKVWERFGDLDIPRDRLSRVGWSKLAIIAETCEPGDELDALHIAEDCTVKDLPRVLRGGKKPPKTHTVLLRLKSSDYERLEAVLLAHGARRPKKGRGLAGKERALVRALGQL